MLVLYLALTILGFACLGLAIKLGCLRGGNPFDLSANMFSLAAVLCGGALFFTGPLIITPSLILWGIVAGVCGAWGFLLFSYALEIGHYGYTLVMMNASFLIPVLFSLVFLDESFTAAIGLGVPLVLLALYLISAHGSAKQEQGKKRLRSRWLVFILSAFVINGLHLIGQAMACRGGGNYLPSYLFYLYLSATLFFLPGIIKRRSFASKSLVFGVVGCVASLVGLAFTQKALQVAPEAIVFPIALSGPSVVGVALSRLLFKDRITFLGYLGVAVGIAGIVILAA